MCVDYVNLEDIGCTRGWKLYAHGEATERLARSLGYIYICKRNICVCIRYTCVRGEKNIYRAISQYRYIISLLLKNKRISISDTSGNVQEEYS